MEYTPLDILNFEIRLLVITPLGALDEDSIVHCTLQHVFLHEQPEYRALSYCWGDPSITKPIAVNDHIIQVTANLEAGLRQLRAENITTIWVDALSINQKDLVERALQVMRMGVIYSKASEVVVWLGEVSETSKDAMAQLRSRKAASYVKEGGPAIHSLFSRVYWRRVWIIQELAKSQKAIIYCGSDSVAWSNLRDILPAELIPLSRFCHQFRRGGAPLTTLIQSGTYLQPKMTLIEALAQTKHFESSDPRDKIYALLNITSDGTELVPIPNYKLSPEDVFFRAFKEATLMSPFFDYLPVRDPSLVPSAIMTRATEWSNLEDGVPAWLINNLKQRTGTCMSLPVEGFHSNFNWQCCPILYKSGMYAVGQITSTIECISNSFCDTEAISKSQHELVMKADLANRTPVGDILNETAVVRALLSRAFDLSPHRFVNGGFKAFTSNTDVTLQVQYEYFTMAFASLWKSSNTYRLISTMKDNPYTLLQRFRLWRDANRDFVLSGRTLRERMMECTESAEYGEESRVAYQRVLEHQILFLHILKDISEAGLRLASGTGGYLGLVPANARVGDAIARIFQATIPIVVRPEIADKSAYQTFLYIGDASSHEFELEGPDRSKYTDWEGRGGEEVKAPTEKDGWQDMFIR